MALTFTVEDGTGLAASNSYVSAADASDYFGLRGGQGWPTDINAQQVALVQATDYIEARFSRQFMGYRTTAAQALSWPRAGVIIRLGSNQSCGRWGMFAGMGLGWTGGMGAEYWSPEGPVFEFEGEGFGNNTIHVGPHDIPPQLVKATLEYALLATQGPLMPQPQFDATGLILATTSTTVGPISETKSVVTRGIGSAPVIWRPYPMADAIIGPLLSGGFTSTRTTR
jgi:hypothetical protein